MAWPRDAYVGQKVVAVCQPERANWGKVGTIDIGRVYMIKAVMPDEFFKSGIGFWFGEYEDGCEVWNGSNMFRPLRTTETGMRILECALKPQREDA